MQVGKLTVQARTDTGKGASRRYRAQGLIPGVCYGTGLDAPVNFVVSPKVLKASLDPIKRTNTVIEVTLEGANSLTFTAMVKDSQVDPIRRELAHVDLVAIDVSKKVEVEIPVTYTGSAIGLIEGGQIHQVRHFVPVLCKPTDIPGGLVLDVSELDIGDALHISDLTFPPGVTPTVSEKLTILTCVAPKAEEVTAVAAEAVEGEAAKPAEGEAKPAGEGDAKKADQKAETKKG